MKKAVILVLLVLLSGCINIGTNGNLKDIITELKNDKEKIFCNPPIEADLMFDDSDYALNVYNPNVLVQQGKEAKVGVTIMNIYSQPSDFSLRVDSEYASIVGGIDFLEPGEFVTKTVTIKAPDKPSKFYFNVFLDRNENNIGSESITVKVI